MLVDVVVVAIVAKIPIFVILLPDGCKMACVCVCVYWVYVCGVRDGGGLNLSPCVCVVSYVVS